MAATVNPGGNDSPRGSMPIGTVRPRVHISPDPESRGPHTRLSTHLSPRLAIASSTAIGSLAGGVFLGAAFGPIAAIVGFFGGLVLGELYDWGYVAPKRHR